MTRPDEPLLDFGDLAGRLRRVAPVLALVALLGASADALASGLSGTLLLRWAALLAMAVLVGVAVLTAVHALGGADRAQRRGQRLSGEDVGLLPSRRPDAPER